MRAVITLKKAGERHHSTHEGQKTWRTFDIENLSDPFREGFRALESLNEEGLEPGACFSFRCSNDVEVLTYALKGVLIQEDPAGGATRTLEAGEWGLSSARSGSTHRTINSSDSEGARALQCALTPDRARLRTPPTKKRFLISERRGILRLIISPDGREESLRCRQDARAYSSVLDPGHHVIHELQGGRAAWLQVVSGRIQLIDQTLGEGDAASYEGEPAVSLTAREPSEILLFDFV